jgi:rare lipoprotein A (peptidoglycan hydrolase)
VGNKRWCCGDRTHLDLSYAAFDQIAMRHRGVVDIKVRPADCSKQGTVAFYE